MANLKAPPGPSGHSDGAEGGMGEPVLVGATEHSPRSNNLRPFDNPVSPVNNFKGDFNNPADMQKMMTKNYQDMMRQMMESSDDDSFGTDMSYSRGTSAFTQQRKHIKSEHNKSVKGKNDGPKILEPPNLFNHPSRLGEKANAPPLNF